MIVSQGICASEEDHLRACLDFAKRGKKKEGRKRETREEEASFLFPLFFLFVLTKMEEGRTLFSSFFHVVFGCTFKKEGGKL